ncbi:hypothetical protein BDR04DRAFT_1110657 [Suillus decipiens]|nr:hypothetical protein BDR04DRAFT_1110657 [Suillus decipiens]
MKGDLMRAMRLAPFIHIHWRLLQNISIIILYLELYLTAGGPGYDPLDRI